MSDSICPGAIHQPGSCRFTVWAPRARRVTLRLVGPVHRDVPMLALPHGYFEAELTDVGPGQRYLYRLNDGPDRPDPASRWQPDGQHAPSAVVDRSFDWRDAAWRGKPLADLVIYELHIGTFTREGTFDAAVGELSRLRDLGITAIEIMPVAQFPGWRNWGYDGAYLFAVQNSYGGVPGLKRLVQAVHDHGIAVLLDVVYNHLGPEGNYLRDFGPYFTDRYRTPWGEALNYDGPGSDAVRDFVVANALMWQEEFHLDGLRLDAVPCVKDFTARHVLAEVVDRTSERAAQLGRPFHLIGESDLNDPRILRPKNQGGMGLSGQWSDDFHHTLHAYLTGERTGYYIDSGSLAQFAQAYRDAFLLTGQYSAYWDRRHGASANDRPGEQFVICLQNHDQVGNRMQGDRLTTQLDLETLKLAAALLLTAPYLPLLFMGEEYGETAPFPFFTSHSDRRLIEAIRQGRKRDFAAFVWKGEPFDAQDEKTFQMAKLRTAYAQSGRGQVLHCWYRELLGLRRGVPVLARLDRQAMEVSHTDQPALMVVHRWAGGSETWLVFHFGQALARCRMAVPEGGWQLRLSSSDPRWQGPVAQQAAELEGGREVELALSPRSATIWVAN